ncbi:ankyrin repeat-containing domain protein [Xylaria sp. FL0064]|nr:ankyrin repeat-containing domain protein [Xylaria sp. FL0064]
MHCETCKRFSLSLTATATGPRNHGDYTVGWVCALSKEQTAATAMLDEIHPDLPANSNDTNAYTLGSIGSHNIVIACLPSGKIGTNSAATVATQMIRSFPAIRFGLMGGIGGGIPSKVQLGDVVVSVPGGEHPGVVQWDLGKAQHGNNFKRTGALNNPPSILLTALGKLATRHEMRGSEAETFVDDMFIYPPSRETEIKCSPEQNGDRLQVRTRAGKRKYRQVSPTTGPEQTRREVPKTTQQVDVQGTVQEADPSRLDQVQSTNLLRAAIAAAFAKELLGCVQPAEVKRQQPVQELIGQLSNSLETLQRQTVQLASHQQEEEYLKKLYWLTPQNYGSQHSDNLKTLHPETGEWLLRSQVFQEWLDAEANQDRLPGAGKTVMTSKVIQYLESRFSSNERVGIAYLYCNYARQTEQTIEHFIASLSRQLIQKHFSVLETPRRISESLDELYCRHKIKKIQPSRAELSAILQSAVAEYSEVFMIIDALDECNTSNECRIDLLTELFQLQHSSMVRIFATSRINSDTASLFRSASHIQILAHAKDLRSYLESRMNKYDQGLFDDILRQSVIAEIIKAAKGMFLLAKLHIDALLGLPTIGEVKMRLKNLSRGPGGLHAMYEQAMMRIESQGTSTQELAKKVLKWIFHARSPLSIAALQHALAIRPELSFFDKDFIPRPEVLQSCCAGLVTIDKESDIVRLIHYTTQEYFETSSSRWFPEAQLDMSKDCITYLSYSDFARGCCVHKNNYAKRCRRAARIYEDAISFMKKKPQLEASIQTLRAERCHGWSYKSAIGMTALHLAAYMGLYEVVKATISRHGSDIKDAHGWTPTSYAAVMGHAAVLEQLLGHGADPDSQDGCGMTPLLYASPKRDIDALLAYGADINYEQLPRDITPLIVAVRNGDEVIVELLLTQGAKIDLRVLSYTAEKGHTNIARLLLAHGADPNVLLSPAVRFDHESIVQLLLADRRIHPDVKAMFGNKSYLVASKNEKAEIVKLLSAETMPDLEHQPLEGRRDTASYPLYESRYVKWLQKLQFRPNSALRHETAS